MTFDCVLMDLDGSTLNADGGMPRGLEAEMRNDRDLRWIMVTGRGFASASMLPHASLVARSLPHVFDGGATVMSMDRQVLLARTLPPASLQRFLRSIDLGAARYMYASCGRAGTGLCWYRREEGCPALVYRQATADADEFYQWLKRERISKLTIWTPAPVQTQERLTLTRNGRIVDVTPAGMDKGSGAQVVFERLGLAPRRSIFIFNDENDVPLLENRFFAGIGRLKVGSAMPAVRADYAAASPDEVAGVLRIAAREVRP